MSIEPPLVCRQPDDAQTKIGEEDMPGKRQDASFLRVLFPEQGFVIWQADAF